MYKATTEAFGLRITTESTTLQELLASALGLTSMWALAQSLAEPHALENVQYVEQQRENKDGNEFTSRELWATIEGRHATLGFSYTEKKKPGIYLDTSKAKWRSWDGQAQQELILQGGRWVASGDKAPGVAIRQPQESDKYNSLLDQMEERLKAAQGSEKQDEVVAQCREYVAKWPDFWQVKGKTLIDQYLLPF